MAINRPITKTIISTTAWGIPITDEVNRIASLTDSRTPTVWTAPTFLNGWANFATTGNRTLRYRKVGDMVQIEGLIKGTATASPVFNLPVGFRPPMQVQFPLYGNVPAGGAITVAGDFYAQFGDPNAYGIMIQFSITP